MSNTKPEYFYYDPEELIGRCTVCPGNMYEAPYFAHLLDLTEEQRKDKEIGLWKIGFCPECYHVEMIWL